MKLIVGLGNPGHKYEGTRHNLGAQIIRRLTSRLQSDKKLSASIDKTADYILAVPDTYMNESGIAVRKIIDYYKLSPDQVYVIHDDLDLPVGEYRLQFDRGPAGHNGIKSIIDHLGTQAFHRVRVGTDHPRNSATPNLPVDDYVLLPFTPEQKLAVEKVIPQVTEEIQKILVK